MQVCTITSAYISGWQAQNLFYVFGHTPSSSPQPLPPRWKYKSRALCIPWKILGHWATRLSIFKHTFFQANISLAHGASPLCTNIHVLAPSLLPCTYRFTALLMNCFLLRPSTYLPLAAYYAGVPSCTLLSIPHPLRRWPSMGALLPEGLTFPRTYSVKIPSAESGVLAQKKIDSLLLLSGIETAGGWDIFPTTEERENRRCVPHSTLLSLSSSTPFVGN